MTALRGLAIRELSVRRGIDGLRYPSPFGNGRADELLHRRMDGFGCAREREEPGRAEVHGPRQAPLSKATACSRPSRTAWSMPQEGRMDRPMPASTACSSRCGALISAVTLGVTFAAAK